MREGFSEVISEDQKNLQDFCAVRGLLRASQILGISYVTLQRAMRGLPIRHETYVKLMDAAAAYNANPPPEVDTVIDLPAEDLEAVKQHAERWGIAKASAKLGIARPTLEKILYGGTRLQRRTLKRLQEQLASIAKEPEEPVRIGPFQWGQAPPQSRSSQPRDLALEQELEIWLQDVRNRRTCREILARAQRKQR